MKRGHDSQGAWAANRSLMKCSLCFKLRCERRLPHREPKQLMMKLGEGAPSDCPLPSRAALVCVLLRA